MFFKVFKRKIAKIFFFTFLVQNRKNVRAPHLTAVKEVNRLSNTLAFDYEQAWGAIKWGPL